MHRSTCSYRTLYAAGLMGSSLISQPPQWAVGWLRAARHHRDGSRSHWHQAGLQDATVQGTCMHHCRNQLATYACSNVGVRRRAEHGMTLGFLRSVQAFAPELCSRASILKEVIDPFGTFFGGGRYRGSYPGASNHGFGWIPRCPSSDCRFAAYICTTAAQSRGRGYKPKM